MAGFVWVLNGTVVAISQSIMNTTSSLPQRTSTTEPTSMLRWVFHRGGHALTCAVEATADRSSYDVCVFPHWNVSLGTVECFDAPGGALQRHAEIASRLREAGWVAQYSATEDTDVAA
jgi:hypothetical protein